MKYQLVKDDDGLLIDQDGVCHESPSEWLFTGILGGCGCGSSDEMEALAVRVLTLFAMPHEKRDWSVYDDKPEAEVMAHWMDSQDLIEHGTGIGGSWLTPKGQEIYDAINALGVKP